ncbi:RING-type domain-containing protein [Psidium guajava]|nr:RING-type domain-containing protein [Psidium guajava]
MHHGGILLKSHAVYFRFKKTGWDQIVVANGFLSGQEIDCWYLYDAEDGPRGSLRFLIQPVGDYMVPQEAASGGAGTSGGS